MPMFQRTQLTHYIFIAFFVALPTMGVANTIKDIRLWQSPQNTQIVIEVTQKPQYKYFYLSNPVRLVIDFYHTTLKTDINKINIQGTVIHRIRTGNSKPNVRRIVLDLRKEAQYKVYHLSPNKHYRHRIFINLASHGRTASPIFEKLERHTVIVIDPGHGGEDPGAPHHGIKEKNVAMSIARYLAQFLARHDEYKVLLTRDGDYNVSLHQRRNFARSHQADLLISVHADAYATKTKNSPSGLAVYILDADKTSSAEASFLAERENKSDLIAGVVLDNKDDILAEILTSLSMSATLETSNAIGKMVLQELSQVGKLHKRGVGYGNFTILRSPDVPAILVESGFLTNPTEARKLKQKVYRKNIAQSIYHGVHKYFKQVARQEVYRRKKS